MAKTSVSMGSIDELELQAATDVIRPIPVMVVQSDEPTEGADFGTYMNYAFSGTANDVGGGSLVQRILPLDKKRTRAIINLSGPAGSVAYIGKREQVLLNQNMGFRLTVGPILEVENIQELWAAGDGTNASFLSVMTERNVG